MKYSLILLSFLFAITISCNKKIESTKKTETKTTTTTKVDSSAVDNIQPEEITKEKENLAAVIKSIEKKPQSFVINTEKQTTITGREKTKVTFSAGSFVSAKNGKEIKGKVNIELREYYTVSDMIIAGLSTTSNGHLLETGGMIYIAATSNGEEAVLGQGKSIEIEMPQKQRKPGMNVYTGAENDGSINWILQKESVDLSVIHTQVDQRASFPNGVQSLYKEIEKNLDIPNEELKDGTLHVNIIIDRTGKVRLPKIEQGLSKVIDERVLEAFAKLPNFNPALINGKPVNSYLSVPFMIELTEDTFTGLKNEEGNQVRVNRANANSFLFATNKLGWINCDRLLAFGTQAVEYKISIPESTSRTFLILKKYRAIIAGIDSRQGGTFENMPIGEEVTAVAMKSEKGKIYLAVKSATITKETLTDLNFVQVSKSELKAALQKLD